MSKIFLIDAATGKEELRDMTAEEQATFDADVTASAKSASDLSTAKNALLKKLGITQDEANLLLG
jgi:hypothetical protein